MTRWTNRYKNRDYTGVPRDAHYQDGYGSGAMARCFGVFWGLTVFLTLAPASFGQQTRTYMKDGVKYRETREMILRPVTEIRYEQRERTVYREEVSTEMREIHRVVQVPVTEYQWESFWVNRFWIFGRPHLAYHLVPRTRLESRTEIVKRPVTIRRLIPEKRIDRVPIVTRRMVEEEVIRRVVVSPPPPPDSKSRLTRRREIGGRKLYSDPPRQSSGWRPAGGTYGRY